MVLVTGGSQGASGLNQLMLDTLPTLVRHSLQWQWLHLTGPNDVERVKQTYARLGLQGRGASVLLEMDLALGAATAGVSRAGASSLAELAAMRLPCLLVPFPAAADNHQFHNARAFEETGAARLLEQRDATPEKVSDHVARTRRRTSACARKCRRRWPDGTRRKRRSKLRRLILRRDAGSPRNSPSVQRAGCGDRGRPRRAAPLVNSTQA